jgi:peptidoglycan/LPS O-acetylase OafA/YrhL
VLAGIVGFAGIAATYRWTSLESATDRIWGPSAIALSLCLFLAAGIRRSWFGSRVLSVLTYPGQLSYGGYLLHASVLFVLWPFLRGRTAGEAFLVYGAATLLLAALVYRGFEVPANRAIRKAGTATLARATA